MSEPPDEPTKLPPELAATKVARFETFNKDQFEALGRFVQAFELMVQSVRSGCVWLLDVNETQHQLKLQTVFHHQVFTAKPLFDVWRALIMQSKSRVSRLQPYNDLDDINLYSAVLKQVAKSYAEAVELRNALLHGTWYIGWKNDYQDEEDWQQIPLSKSTVGKDGLKRVEVPKTLDALRQSTKELRSTQLLIDRLGLCLRSEFRLEHNTIFDGKRYWDRSDPAVDSTKET